MGRRLGLTAVLVAVVAVRAAAQTPGPPAGSKEYFGAPPNQPFTPGNIFAPPAPPPPPPIGAGADGGLLPSEPPPPKVWTGSVEAGLNGATGNSELFNLRAGWNAQRKVAGNVFTSDFLYTLTKNGRLTTTNQALLNVRDEILFPGRPWSLFAAVNLEYDELRAYDFRVGVYGGAGYTVFDDDDGTFRLRAGAGAVREIDTRDDVFLPAASFLRGSAPATDRWVPEFVFGYDLRLRVTDRSSFLSVLDYYPRIDDWSQFRLRVRAAYEVVLDPVTCTVLRLGVQDRYDSNPGPAQKNDLTYFATLGIKF